MEEEEIIDPSIRDGSCKAKLRLGLGGKKPTRPKRRGRL